MRELVSQAQAAEWLGITRQSVGRWMVKAGAPVERRGGRFWCVWPDFPVWRRAERDASVRRKAGYPALEAAKLRRASVEAELAELNLAERRGDLVGVEDYRRELRSIMGRLRGILVRWPAEWAPRFVELTTTGQAEGELFEGCRVLLARMARVGDDYEEGA